MKICTIHSIVMLFIAIMISGIAYSQHKELAKTSAGFPVNYDEEKVGNYTLPDVLTLKDGKKVKDVKTWEKKRRPEIVKMFEETQYGKMPSKPADLSFKIQEKIVKTKDRIIIRKQITIYFTRDTSSNKMDLLIYLPSLPGIKAPVLLTINFTANSLMVNDSGVRQGEIWSREGKKIPASQGRAMGKFDIDKFISNGFGVAFVYYGDIEPDFKKGINYGIRGHYLKPGTTQPAPDEWGAISAWAWGLSRAMDYFEADPQLDAKRVALFGISRLGKTVLWTGAHDTRFKMVIASCSGEGGAALSRRDYGENIKHLTDTSRYFYQFAANYHSYAPNVNNLPFDAHMLVALMAPRPLLLQTGDTDYWSDPKGEFLSAIAAEPVYKLYNLKGPGTDVMPKAGGSGLLNPLGYYMHNGGHGIVPSDWDIFITYMQKYL